MCSRLFCLCKQLSDEMGENNMFDTCLKFFESKKVSCAVIKEGVAFRTNVKCASAIFSCVCKCEQHKFALMLLCGMYTPEEKREEMGKFLHIANYGLIGGRFEYDYSDGEIRFVLHQLIQENFTTERIKIYLGIALAHMERYWPGIVGVCFKNYTAAQAAKECESTEAVNRSSE